MTDFDRMLREDFSGPDSTDLWMADTFASYPPGPTGYSTIMGSSSPSSDCFEFHPSFSDHHVGVRGREHVFASTHQSFSSGRFSSGGPFDALGVMRVDRLPPQFLMEQPPLRTVHMSDVIVPNAPSPTVIISQPRPDPLPSLSSPPTVCATRKRIRRIQSLDDGESEVDSGGDSYCPSEVSSPPADHPSVPASPLLSPPPTRRRRRQDINLPVPVPNLTKKSRGRKVPTSSGEPVYALSKDKSKKGTRTYTCHVDGCGKCFVRSEHLKRHIRSIHTNDKPWVCPVWGCERSFSRRDNLNQHMRIHKSPSN